MQSETAASIVNGYLPVDKGYKIDVLQEHGEGRALDNGQIGVVRDNPRLHRRALYPPADKSMIWDEAERSRIQAFGFRPLITAYHEPHFLFDFHIAGGILGQLFIGIILDGTTSKWLHEWADIRLSYAEGQMNYKLRDPQFPGMEASLSAVALAGSAGVIVKAEMDGANGTAQLVWAYGGASAIYDHHVLEEEDYRFRPSHCEKDLFVLSENRFELTRGFDEKDTYITNLKGVAKGIPGWKARVIGGSSGNGIVGFGDPELVLERPESLIRHAVFSNENPKTGCVAVGKTAIDKNIHYLAVGMGGNIREVLGDFEGAWAAALERNKGIVERIVTHTPDEYLDSAVSMAAVVTDGMWGDETFMHGAWSWRSGYMGWRGWYGPACYGWLDRIKKAIGNHIRLSRNEDGDDQGAVGFNLESGKDIYFNMNEVFIDQIRQYLDYSNDTGMLEELFEIVEGIVEWEDRRLRPLDEPLYENSLNTWISDSHWNIRGQCTQASAYIYRAYSLLTDLAKRIGKDPAMYEKAAGQIKAAMNNKLWLSRKGVFAEYIDTVGEKLIHPEPELASIYHPVEFEVADEFQTWQMLHWAERHLRTEQTPGGGKLYWSSNWFPNKGRKNTHSTYILAYGEELNFALAHLSAGRTEEAYAIIRGCLRGFFNGPAPGGLSCQMKEDGSQLHNEDFSDSVSMFGRAVAEGLFGIVPKKLDHRIQLTPMLPSGWEKAEIQTPQLSYSFAREHGRIVVRWESPEDVMLDFRMPVQADEIRDVLADGMAVPHQVEPGIGFTWVKCVLSPACKGEIAISYQPRRHTEHDTIQLKQHDSFCLELGAPTDGTLYDPQGVISNAGFKDGKLIGTVAGEPSSALAFIQCGGPECPYWMPVEFEITPAVESNARNAWVSPALKDRDLAKWSLVDIGDKFNASSPEEVLRLVAERAVPPANPASTVGFKYWRAHLIDMGVEWKNPPTAEAWRNKTGPDGIAWTSEGIPVQTSKAGPNLAVVTLAGGYPERLEFPVHEQGKMLYLMISGMTFPNQSHVVNLRIRLQYENGDIEAHDLVNPHDIGDCWGFMLGRFHDTPRNGFENIGGRFGPGGSDEVQDLLKPVSVDTEAHLLAFPMRDNLRLTSIRVEAAANDVIFAIMGMSVYKG